MFNKLELVEKLIHSKHMPLRHDQQRHAGTRIVSEVVQTVRRNLSGLAYTSKRKALLDDFAREFPQALEAAGLSIEQVEEIYVVGSYVSDKPNPNDLDLIVYVPTAKFTVELQGNQYEAYANLNAWSQWEGHKTPITFDTDREHMLELLDMYSSGATRRLEGYRGPLRIYP